MWTNFRNYEHGNFAEFIVNGQLKYNYFNDLAPVVGECC
jgi:hypothetical protein